MNEKSDELDREIVDCPNCGGIGSEFGDADICQVCGGTGEIEL